MYTNPYDRIKKLKDSLYAHGEDKQRVETFAKNGPNARDSYEQLTQPTPVYGARDHAADRAFDVQRSEMNEFALVKDVVKEIKRNDSNNQFIVILDNGETKSDSIINELAGSIFAMPVINIDMKKIELYGSPFLFLLKRVVKGLPTVTLEDKKVLWDRIKLFSKTLSQINSAERKDASSEVIVNELEFDDPIEYIKNEFKEIVKAYDINDNIVLLFTNVNVMGYERFRSLLLLVTSIFRDIKPFKAVVGVNSVLITNYVKKAYGDLQINQLFDNELNLFDKVYNRSEVAVYEEQEVAPTGAMDGRSAVVNSEPVKANPNDYWSTKRY